LNGAKTLGQCPLEERKKDLLQAFPILYCFAAIGSWFLLTHMLRKNGI